MTTERIYVWLGKTACIGVLFYLTSFGCAAVELAVPYLEQPDNVTCLPTCLTMALHYMGRETLTSETVQKLQKRTHFDRYNVPAIVKDYGLYALPTWHELGWTQQTVENELDHGRPVILGLNLGPVGHFVLATGYTNDHKIIINDPWHKEPGWPLGGPRVIADWSALTFRGGIMIRSEPFPADTPPPGKILKESYPQRMAPGEIADVFYEVKNTGATPWPDGVFLAPIDPVSTASQRSSAFYDGQDWFSPSRIKAPSKPGLAPGDTAQFVFKIRAPGVTKATTFKEHWNLVGTDGHWLDGKRLVMREDHEAAFTIVVAPPSNATLPLRETSSGAAPTLPWQVKHGTIVADDTTTKTPDGSRAWRLFTPGQSSDAAWLGNGSWADYHAEAMIYCDLRHSLRPEFERVGLFVRDNGQHAGDTKNDTEIGECYAMTFDSDDGGIRAGNIVNGTIDDFRPKPRFKLTESGWHKFSVKCAGETLTYELDGKPFFTGQARLRNSGECGVYYRSVFANPAKWHGVSFAGFTAVSP